jgi:hypothetical protein
VELGPLSIPARDEKLRSIALIDLALKIRRQLEPALVVNPSWIISTEHCAITLSSFSICRPANPALVIVENR